MFDIGFWELVLVGVVALVVVGPERLPGLARTAGMWVGRLRYFVNNVKADINREFKSDELKRILEEQARMPELHDLVNETRWSFTDTKTATASDTIARSGNKIAPAAVDALAYNPDDFDDFSDVVEVAPPKLTVASELNTNGSPQ